MCGFSVMTQRLKIVGISMLILIVLPTTIFGKSSFDEDGPVFEGKVLVEEVKHSTGIPGLRATFVIHSTREAIWKALTDYVNFRKIFDGIDKMEVSNQDKTGVTIEFWISVLFFEFNYVLQKTYERPGRELSWIRVSGDLKDIRGRWLIEDTSKENIYIVKYESYIDVGNFVFNAGARFFARNKAKSMAIRLRKWVEAHQ